MAQSFCSHLIGTQCNILNTRCFRLNLKKKCEFQDHYDLIRNFQQNPIKTQLVKQSMLRPFLNNWRNYAILPSSGKKNMTGISLENAIRDSIKMELSSYNVTVYNRGKKIQIWKNAQASKGVNIIADVYMEKENCPSSIVSVKSWLGTTQIRETFAYAYFSKSWFGHKSMRVFMATLHPIRQRLQTLMVACKPYIDGFYSLNGIPYFDDLINELINIYK